MKQITTETAIAAAERRTLRAEAAALQTEFRLAIARAKIAEFETAAAKRKDADAIRAVRQMVATGAIRKADTFAQHEYTATFMTDPTLIPLAIGKAFNARKSKHDCQQ